MSQLVVSDVVGHQAAAHVEEADAKRAIRDLHVNDKAGVLKHNLVTALFVALLAAALYTWNIGVWPLTVVVWLAAGHVGHMKLIAVHEASHGTLSGNRFRNELQGVLLGSAVLVPLSAYRFVHGRHHAYLGTPGDLELWPFVNTRTPRVWRISAAIAELLLGFFYTPFLFLRGVLAGDRIPRHQTIRIMWEYGLCAVMLVSVLGMVAYFGWWEQYTVAYLVPAVIAGNLQSLRKFTEHLGLLGDSILTLTRTVVDPSQPGKLLSDTMMHIDYHGTHHRYARLPYYNLPPATPYVYDGSNRTVPIFPTYLSAMLDMARSLGNPRVGSQWLKG